MRMSDPHSLISSSQNPVKVRIRPRHQFNVDALSRYLLANLGLIVLEIDQFSEGQSNPSFLLRTITASNGDVPLGNERNEQWIVLRKRPHGKLLRGAHAIDREFWILNKLYEQGFPVPRPRLFCEDESVIGQSFFLMDYVQGRIFKDARFEEMQNDPFSKESSVPTVPSITPQDRHDMYMSFLSTLARLHSLNVRDMGLEGFGRSGNYYNRQISTWTRQYKASETHKIQAMDRLMEWLPENIPAHADDENSASIVHGDYKIDNVIFHPHEPRIIAVLDWELSTIGNPLADLAYSCIFFHFPKLDKSFRGLKDENLHELGIPDEKECIRTYQRLIGRDKDDIAYWHFYVAFSIFRLAAILQGVYKRSLSGNASSAYAKQVGLLTESMSNTAWELIEEHESRNTVVATGGISLRHSERVQVLKRRLLAFMDRYVYPNEAVYRIQHAELPSRWMVPPIIEQLKNKARELQLWNLFLPQQIGNAPGLTNTEYAPLAEIMGRSFMAPEIFNCSAPDTGNMEVLFQFGTQEQQDKWLIPLLNGSIRSCFAMTEPDIASSDATNISCSITRTDTGSHYIINGHKWWITGANHPHCKFAIVMGRTDETHSSLYSQHSMIIVPMDTPGVRVVRNLQVFGFDDAPQGHSELVFENVRVPVENILLGEGRGFEIAQARLGPGRVHHCMRLIGASERAMERTCRRIDSRIVFGKFLSEQGMIQRYVAESRTALEQARLLVLKCAYLLDTKGNTDLESRQLISMIKVVVPNMALKVIDNAIQVHGAGGLSEEDFGLATSFAGARALRFADGPDEVHLRTVFNLEKRRQQKLIQLAKL